MSSPTISAAAVRSAIAAARETVDSGAWAHLLDVLPGIAVGVPLGGQANELVYHVDEDTAAPTFFAFTDLESAQAYDGPVGQWAQMPLPVLCRSIAGTPGARLALNASGPAPLVLEPDSITYLAGPAEDDADRVSIEVPTAAPPERLASAARRVLLGYPAVRSAYAVSIRAGSAVHWGLALGCDDQDEYARAVEGLRSVLPGLLAEWEQFDAVPLTADSEPALVRAGLRSLLE